MAIFQLISTLFEYIVQALYLLAHNIKLIFILGYSYALRIEALARFSPAILYFNVDIAKFSFRLSFVIAQHILRS